PSAESFIVTRVQSAGAWVCSCGGKVPRTSDPVENRKQQLEKLLERFKTKKCKPELLRDDIEAWRTQEYPPEPESFFQRYVRQVQRNLDELARTLGRGPTSPTGPLPPILRFLFEN